MTVENAGGMPTPEGEQRQYPLDAIVVLSAAFDEVEPGRFVPDYLGRTRVRAGAEAYHQGIAPMIVLTGGRTQGDDKPTEARVELDYLNSRYRAETGRFRKVDPKAIILEEEYAQQDRLSKTTESNIENLIPLLRQRGWSKVGILTNDFHLPGSLKLAEIHDVEAEPLSTEGLLEDRNPHFAAVFRRFEQTDFAQKLRRNEKIRTVLLRLGPLRKPVEWGIKRIRS